MRGIDPKTWTLVSPLLDRALDLSPDERPAFLARVRAERPSVAGLLEDLLADHDRVLASDFLQSPVLDAESTLAGTSIGAYTLEAPLGSGGMGTVWRARRSDGRFEGAVAVKLLHLAALRGTGAERFAREGTFLARLSHPNIARLFDAGVTSLGQPYLVLQLVEGLRIDEYTDEARLGVEARLGLFLQVADAVAHAHAHLVVHRDIKPSNILVDGTGHVTLLDFGIARLVEGDGPRTDLSLTDGRALTPEYASPEQIRGAAITTSTDIYTLGVLLYCLLTGAHPTGDGSMAPLDHARGIVEREPRPASGAVANANALEIAEKRGTTPERLARRLAGDLDTILGKALKKVPDERYPTATAFADDVRRHLAREPVLARADSTWYRWRRFVDRHRLELGAAAAIALALVAGTGVAVWQAARSADERDRALEQLRRAEAVNDFSSFLLTEARPTAGRPISNADLLARGEAVIDSRYASDPVLRTRMLLTLAERYQENQQFDAWRRVLQRAYDDARGLDDMGLRAYATCAWAGQFAEREEARKALEVVAEVLATLPSGSEDADATEICLQVESLAANRLGDTARAVGSARRAVAFEEARNAPPNRLYPAVMILAAAQRGANEFGAASEAYRRASALLEQQGLGDTVRAAVLLNNWSAMLQGAGQYIEAATLGERAVDLARRADSENGASLTMLSTWAAALSATGDFAAATMAIDESLEKARVAGSPPRLLNSLGQAIVSATEAGDVARATRLLAEARQVVPPDAATLSRAILQLSEGRVALAEDHPEAAAGWTRRALESLASANANQASLLPTEMFLARCLNASGQFAEALAVAERSRATATGRLGDRRYSSAVGAALLEVAAARRGLGDADASRAAATKALEHLRPTVGPAAPATRRAERLATAEGAEVR